MTQAVADDVAMAVQVAADDGLHRRAAQAVQQPGARLGIDRRRRHLGLVRRLQEQRLVQGQQDRSRRRAELGIEPGVLLAFLRQP